jgi:(2Fe-2S) ferredoxin
LNNLLDDDRPSWLRDLEPATRHRVHVCFGKNCTPNGAQGVFAAFQAELASSGLGPEVELIATSCRSRCELGPSVNVYPGPVTYGQMTPERVREVVREHLCPGGAPVHKFLVTDRDVAEAKRRAGV